ncbi:MAG TPA: ribonuclease D [Steroidobacteraceae bacterium]|nr:ribonuclease D [Steroidobacteraceae bacterium]
MAARAPDTRAAVQDIVTNQADLEQLALRLASAEAIGLDTEFLRERTYRAELCLLQIADPAGPLCVDPLALENLEALVPVLGAAQPLKVMHASRQDIEVLFPAVGALQGIFDTQIAAALTGLPAQIGYGELVKRLLGRELSKAHTRTDWSRRPLSGEQLSYALDDVRYLLPLRAHLTAQIAQLGRTGWLAEELHALADPRGYAVEPEQAWLRIKGLRGLDPARARVARALAAWRERRAIERNRPRGWILEDATLREIVVRVPRSLTELAAIADMPAAVVKHCGTEILDSIRSADVPEALAPVVLRARPDPRKAALVKHLSAIHQAVAAELHLSPEVLATRRDLEQLADGERAVPVLGGWRREVIGERLLAAL